MSPRLPIVACCALTLAAAASLPGNSARAADDAGVEFYEKKVRPVLAAHCYKCHGPEKQEAGLQVDSVAAMLRGGDQGASIVPGNPDESLLVEGIKYDNLDFQMPPKQKLADAEIAAIVEWIKQGAPAPKDDARQAAADPKKVFDLAERKKHWCFQPLAKVALPGVKNEAWVRGDIDRYILAKVEGAKIAPAPEADPRTLIRRLSFDLTGLPPTPAEVETFVRDYSPSPANESWKQEHAYEQLVDKLLASPHFGERWGRHWLDLVRYAESRGHEFDYLIPNAFRYRDYVVRAFNDDVPYDRFVVEHLAGDLLAKPRVDGAGANQSILGTGFWFLGEECHSPVDIRQDETDRVDNKIDVMSKTFLGLTLACARCHDHKFDAISTKDYYALSGYVLGMSYRQTAFEADLKNRKVYDDVRRLDEENERTLRGAQHKRFTPVLEQADRYLLAARAAWVPGISEKAKERRSAAIEEAARRFEVDETRLAVWVEYLISPESKIGALSLWREFIETKQLPERLTAAAISQRTAAGENVALTGLRPPLPETTVLTKSTVAPGEEHADTAPRVIVDFAAPEVWLVDGLAWGDGPRRLGSVQVGSGMKTLLRRVATADGAAVDPQWDLAPGEGPPNEPEAGRLNWRQTGRTIKTPTFTLETGKLRYRMRGSAKVYAAVASHRVNNGPLHGKLAKTFAGGDDYRWVEHDLSEYAGRRVHLEFSPLQADELKPNQSAELSLRGVVEDRPMSSSPTADAWDFNEAKRLADDEAALRKGVAADELRSLDGEAQAEALAKGLKQMLVEAARNVLIATDEPVRPAAAAVVDSMLAHRELWTGDVDVFSELVLYFSERADLLQRLRPPTPTAPAAWEGTAVDEQVLIRGNHRTAGDVVPRRYMEAFDGPVAPAQGPGRLQLAERIVNGRDPLPARVMVNRLWQHLFGRGIVRTVDNFGIMGEPPTHPELLDHLAAEFMADKWSMKRAIRRMVLSSTYRMASTQSSLASTQGTSSTQSSLASMQGTLSKEHSQGASSHQAPDQIDPQNNLFHRANVKRLEGEIVRDALLAVSGRLDRQIMGPSVEVYLTPFMEGRGRPQSGPLDGEGRRSIYLRVRRNFLNPMFQAFDYPTPFTSVGRRSTSNVPAQALSLMNGPLVVELSKQWAERAKREVPGDAGARIDRLYEQAFARRPTADERATTEAFLESQAAAYGVMQDDSRVWADLCHVLFNAKEFIYVQ